MSLCTSIMITAREIVSLVTPPMKAPAPMRAKAPGSTQAQGLGVRKTPGGALQHIIRLQSLYAGDHSWANMKKLQIQP